MLDAWWSAYVFVVTILQRWAYKTRPTCEMHDDRSSDAFFVTISGEHATTEWAMTILKVAWCSHCNAMLDWHRTFGSRVFPWTILKGWVYKTQQHARRSIIVHLACLLCFVSPSLQYCYKESIRRSWCISHASCVFVVFCKPILAILLQRKHQIARMLLSFVIILQSCYKRS